MLRLSYFSSEKDNSPRSIEISWEQLVAQLSAPRSTTCTTDGCPGSKCPEKLGPAWSPAAYQPGATRKASAVASVAALVIDLDHLSEVDLMDAAQKIEPYSYIAHASHSDRIGDRCMRVVLELDAPVPGHHWDRFWAAAVAELGLPGVDTHACDRSRIYFLPSRPTGADFLVDTNPGRAIDTARILASAPAATTPAPSTSIAAPDVGDDARGRAIAELLQVWPDRGRHDAFFALAGALAKGGWDADAIEAFTVAIATRMQNSDSKAIADRGPQARDSVDKVARGEDVKGWGALAKHLSRDVTNIVRAHLGMIEPVISVAESSVFDHVLSIRHDAAEPGSFAAHVATALADVTAALGTGEALAEVVPLFGITARELLKKRFPVTPWLVHGLITDGGIAAIATEPKAGKTWCGTEIALAVATGTKVFGEFPTGAPRDVAYFYAEDFGQQVQSRIGALLAGRGLAEAPDRFHAQPRGRFLDLTRDADLALIIASCRMLGPIGLLVLDPLRDVHSGEEDKSDSMAPVMKRLRLLGELLRCTVLFVHHSGKVSENSTKRRAGQRMRGSGAIHGSTDCGIYLSGLSGNLTSTFVNKVLSEVKGARSAGAFDLALEVIDNPTTLTAIKATWRVSRSEVEGATGEPQDGAIDIGSPIVGELADALTGTRLLKKHPTARTLRKMISGKLERVEDALRLMLREGLITKNMIGRKHSGWLLTAAGEAFAAGEADAD